MPNHQYDKIVRENIDELVENIIRNILHIEPISIQSLPEKMEQTKEREADVLKLVTDSYNESFILQIEFQSQSDPEMPYRMLEYCAMLLRKHRIAVRQYVIYLGKYHTRMPQTVIQENLHFRYELINFQNVSFESFLRSPDPQNVVMTILSDFKGRDQNEMVLDILNRLFETCGEGLAFQKHFQQLRILSRLRNLEEVIIAMLAYTEKLYDISHDPLFAQGVEQGIEQGIEQGVEQGAQQMQETVILNLLRLNVMSIEQVASIADAPVELVLALKATL